jgi:phenylalanyl-tRNA synthetase beta chain
MKFSEQWLRQWVNPPLTTQELSQKLTLSGLEVDSVESVAADFTGVVVGHVIDVAQHPDADRLRVCQVDVGEVTPLTIVCGARNVAKDQKVPVAKIDAVLPGNFKIKKSKLRGVESHGMICSESELGLAPTSEGIMELAKDAPIGVDVREYLALNDNIFDIELTPNRGDCLSIWGIAREVAAIEDLPLSMPQINSTVNTVAEQLPIQISATDACPHYIGRVIRHINPQAQTPLALQQKLIRSGIRPINAIVDITNYVLLELGQPLHAFNLDHVQQGIEVRYAGDGETIDLLDDQHLILNKNDLVITDGKVPVALAGVKGGAYSGITNATKNIFLESALFNPGVIAKTARSYGIFTDSSHRYERGIDFQLQKVAIERATMLITEIAGGEVGELLEHGSTPPAKAAINLRKSRIQKILGITLADEVIVSILQRLSMHVQPYDQGWEVTPPTYRHDINIEIDLIEEVARIYGYDKIPPKKLTEDLHFLPASETKPSLNRLRMVLVDNGYQEAITYSFVDPKYEKKLLLQQHPLELLNPISSDLSTMRTNQWPGLIQAFQYNFHRQQPRVRLFEMGLCFLNQPNKLSQQQRLGGLISGQLYPEQWNETKRMVDFYDAKSDVERLLAAMGKENRVKFEPYEHPALHPGQTAAIVIDERLIGMVGALHPSVAQEFDINQTLYLFDLDLDSIMDMSLPKFEALSKFPGIKRDMALVVATDVHAERLRQKILASGGELLKNVHIFDIYQGKGIEQGKKSIALSLIFQHISRTLVDAEINESMQNIISILHKDFNATLRD